MTARRLTRRAFLGVAAAAALTPFATRGAPAADFRPNLLLVTCSGLRRDDLGCFGAPHVYTPAADRLAARGTCFTHLYAAQPAAGPAQAAMLTGLAPCTNGVVEDGDALDPQHFFLMRALRRQGWTTGFSGWQRLGMSPVPICYSRWRGFPPDASAWAEEEPAYARPGETYAAFLERRRKDAEARRRLKPFARRDFARRYRADVAAEEATAFIAEQGDAPFAFWLAFKQPELSEEPPPENMLLYENRMPSPAAERRAAAINRVDNNLRRLLAAIDPAVLERTVVAFAGDYGEALPDGSEHETPESLLDATARVPLVLAGPGVDTARCVDGVASGIDLAPTLLDLCSATRPGNLHGRTMRPLIEDREGRRPGAAIVYGLEEERGAAAPFTRCIATLDGTLFLSPERPPRLSAPAPKTLRPALRRRLAQTLLDLSRTRRDDEGIRLARKHLEDMDA